MTCERSSHGQVQAAGHLCYVGETESRTVEEATYQGLQNAARLYSPQCGGE